MTQETSTAIVAIAASADSVAAIVSNTPEAYRRCQLSHDNCLTACRTLLDRITASGMTDDLDRQAAAYLEKTRRTLRAMNEQRSPVTKLFDQVRREFTTLENDIDPTRAGTVPYLLQQQRNAYAALRRQQEEERRRAEEARRAAEAARAQYRDDCAADYRAQFDALVNTRLNELTEINASVTLDTFDITLDVLTAGSDELPANWSPAPTVRIPLGLDPGQARQIRDEVFRSLLPQFTAQYRAEIGDYRTEIIDRMPSRRTELRRAAEAASAAEAERIRADIARREAEEAARAEAARAARQAEQERQAQVQRSTSEAATLFDQAAVATPAGYQPKTKVTRKIDITAPTGYMQVLSMWWAREGSSLSKEELDKIFRRMITFCERLANRDGEFLTDPGVQYIDEVKAQ